MTKILNDKYYTPQHIVDKVLEATDKIIGFNNITEFIEPSAGNGAFLDKLYATNIPTLAYDLYPERDDIIKQDFLTLDLEYKKGRCVIGNPPFGNSGNLFRSFYNKSVEIAEYIIFIGSIKLLHNTKSLYKYDLIYSEDLGEQYYTDRNLRCCLNIYKQPLGKINKRISFKLKDVLIKADDKRCKQYPLINEDFKMCRMGSKVWQVLNEGQILRNFKVVVYKKEYLDIIINILNKKYKIDGNNRDTVISTPYITQEDVYKYLKEQMPELQ